MLKISFSEAAYALCSRRPLLVSTGPYWYGSTAPAVQPEQLLLQSDAVARMRCYGGDVTGICCVDGGMFGVGSFDAGTGWHPVSTLVPPVLATGCSCPTASQRHSVFPWEGAILGPTSVCSEALSFSFKCSSFNGSGEEIVYLPTEGCRKHGLMTVEHFILFLLQAMRNR